MPKIVIEEKDNTTPGVLDENFDVVYIPGFVNTSLSELWEKNEQGEATYIGLQPRVPTLFTSLSSFIAKCGSAPATFANKQDYRTLNNGKASGFSADAVSSVGTVMFNKDDADPSYIMAKELLAAGLNVVYERVNDTTAISDVEIKLDSFNKLTNGSTYKIDIPAVRPISSPVAPLIYKPIDDIYLVGADDNPIFYTVSFPAGSKETDVTSSSAIYTVFDVDNITAGDATKYNIESVTVAGSESTTYRITPNSKLFIKPVDYFAKGSGKNSTNTIPVVLDAYNNILVKDVPEVSTAALTSYPANWFTNYYIDYYEKTVVSDFISVSSTDVKLSNDTLKTAIVGSATSTISVLIGEGIPQSTCRLVQDSITIDKMYTTLAEIFDASNLEGIVDRGNFNIKYLTSGGYPVFEYNNNSLVTAMLNVAEKRGDCVAIIDHTNNPYRETNVDKDGSLYQAVVKSNAIVANGEFGAMFTPWCTFNRTTSDKKLDKVVSSGTVTLGGSFAYLGALADSIKTNAPWLAIAGATRGKVQNLSENGITTIIPNGAADYMQPRSNSASVNAITNIKPYGNVIWGNRTLKKNDENLIATSFLNIRNLVSDVKKICYRTARKLTFEQNSDVLWVNFKSMIAPTLDKMVSGYGISGYKFVRDTEHSKASAKATLCAKIFLYPVEPVEDFYITIMLEDDEVTVQ